MTARDALRAMRVRAEAATEGPWLIDSIESGEHGLFVDEPSEELGCGGVTVASFLTAKNAEFIAHARTGVPALVEALEAVLTMHWRDTYSDCGRCHVAFPCTTVTAIETALGGAS